MKRYGNKALGALVVFIAVAFPVLVVILAIQGDWWPAVVVVVVWAMAWWRGRHNGRYLPAALRSWLASHQRR